jgi:hypothetical protein
VAKKCELGEKGEAGIVFYQDSDYCYEVTDFDVGDKQYPFGTFGNDADSSLGDEIGDGIENTRAIVEDCEKTQRTNSGALVCDNLSFQEKNDWYLPNEKELEGVFNFAHKLWNGSLYKSIFNFDDRNHEAGTWYMTSTSEQWGEYNPTMKSIYKLFFYGTDRYKDGGAFKIGNSRNNEKDWGGYVRCVRRFEID